MANSIFDLAEFKPYKARWDDRLNALSRRAAYYDGSVFTEEQFGWKALSWIAPRWFKGVRPLYLPLSRAVDVDAGIIPGGWSFSEDSPQTWRNAAATLFRWSKWETEGVLYVHYGAQYGLVGLKVCDLRDQGAVVLEPIDPTRFVLVRSSLYDETPSMSIYVDRRKDEIGKEFEYAEVITPQAIRTFRDGSPFPYADRKAEEVNALGFVPFVEVQHKMTGDPYGECTYQRAIPMLEQLNALASYLAEVVRKHSEPQWAVAGAEPSDMVRSGDRMWFLPQGAVPHILLPKVDIPGILSFIQEIRDQVHDALPELTFDELRKKDQVATATLEIQLMELVLKVQRCRPNYDAGLVAAMQLAGRAGAEMGGDAAQLAPLDDENLHLDDERPVLPLDPKTAMELELQRLELEQLRGAGPADTSEQMMADEREGDEAKMMAEAEE